MFNERYTWVFKPRNRARRYATPIGTPIQFRKNDGMIYIKNSDKRLTGVYTMDYLEELVENGELIRYEKKKSNFNLD